MSTDELIIQGLVTRRGPEAARRYAQQTSRVYRRAVLNPAHFASTKEYRRAFIVSYLFYKHYLQTSIVPHAPAGTVSKQTSATPLRQPIASQHSPTDIEVCERRIDEELASSMPASDAPSWTLGGSLISKRRH